MMYNAVDKLKSGYIVAVDVSGAFNNVDRVRMWKQMVSLTDN
eukprot:CAMPEP_0116971112 /NCGR_PEP_ID=MMETSP0467-20121206/52968_1 /TAXON_ID=283647 /ORGANISM="Mesodinium pulex, Strain SPMC105" /LENGTH=41 /DNA_ID= /DNA_START= /DNA_END= /DNA_ORIENTATION=